MNQEELNALNKWLKDGNYLPDFMRDFHDQKDLFKTMHDLYEENNKHNPRHEMPNWRDGHCYVIDWFLWYMGSRGYTLQKNRTNIKFREFTNWRDTQTYSKLCASLTGTINNKRS